MTTKKTATRNIDNRRLYSLTMGVAYMPLLGKHVPWEAHGERAALILADMSPDLIDVVSQPEKMRLHVGNRMTSYTPDFELKFSRKRSTVWEIKGAEQLQNPAVIEKLKAAELEIVKSERRFLVLNSRELTSSTELRNAQVLKRYANWPISDDQSEAIIAALKHCHEISLCTLVCSLSAYEVALPHIYRLLYRGVLSHDWDCFINSQTVIRLADSP